MLYVYVYVYVSLSYCDQFGSFVVLLKNKNLDQFIDFCIDLAYAH